MHKKQDLGKGIRALLGSIDDNKHNKAKPKAKPLKLKEEINTVSEIDINSIEVNPFQPRKEFEVEALNELMQSIKIHGIIQPITVRKLTSKKFQLISGERRLRASKAIGLERIPAYIRTADDQQMLEMALIENIQRQDLNPVEIALNYQRLIDDCNLTHDELSKQLGKSRAVVSNYLRILKLPADIQSGLKNKELSMGHAKVIAGVNDIVLQIAISKEVIEKSLSVRDTEALVKKYTQTSKNQSEKLDKSFSLPLAYKKIQDKLMESLETKVILKRNASGQGEVIIKFYNDNDLERIIENLD